MAHETADDQFGTYLAQVLGTDNEITSVDREAVIRLWRTLLGEDIDVGWLEDAVLEGGGSLELRPGSWTIDLSSGLARTTLSLATIAGGLLLMGTPPLSPMLLPALLPWIFDIRRTVLTKSEEMVYMELRLVPDAAVPRPARARYDALPDELREQLSYLDFVDVLEAIRQAGLVTADMFGDLTITDRPRLRIKIV